MQKVIVIGAGPAGCIAAILLARGGFRVTVIEQHTFPRHKVCGECLSSLGISVLRRHDLASALTRLNPTILTRTVMHAPNGPPIELSLPEPMWGLSRHAMDFALLSIAREHGVVVRQPARCEGIIPGSPPVIRWRCLATNQMVEEQPDWVIAADGKGTMPPPGPVATSDFGIKRHCIHVDGPRDAIELFGLRGAYGGLAAIEGNQWNAAFSVPVARLRAHSGNLDSMFRQMMDENQSLRHRLHAAKFIGPWLASPLPRFSVASGFPLSVIPIGNAAGALEPVGGEGMGLAMRSAELAAEALLVTTGDQEKRVNGLPKVFGHLWKKRSITCRLVAQVFSNPVLADAVADWGGTGELFNRLLRLTGKKARMSRD